jgi:uncharacterized membrane protein YfcA
VEVVAVLLAGVAAGTINVVVGSGTLVTFPTLLAFGMPPVSANVSNNLGLVFGSVTGTWGYRRELEGQRLVLARLAPLSLVGSIAGALLLLRLPESAFTAIVPVLIGISMLLVLTQTRVSTALRTRRARSGRSVRPAGPVGPVGPVAGIGVLLAGVYGGYFGAAQGVLLIGWLGLVLEESLQRVNATKNFLSAIVNGVAAVTFLVVSPEAVSWAAAGLIAVGSVLGGLLGVRAGRRLRPAVLRAVIVIVGAVAISRLVLA